MIQVNDVAAKSGATWIADAFRLWRAQPFQWIAVIALWMLLSLVALLFPLIGPVLSTLLQPVFMAGMMLAARDQQNGQLVTVRHLFAAFAVNGRALMVVGSVTLAAELAALVFLSLVEMPQLPFGKLTPADIAAMQQALDGHRWKVITAFAFITGTNAILWFTAPLLAFHAIPASHAIRWSAYAMFSNVLPMLLFAVLMTLVFMVALLPWGLGLAIVMPILMIAHYTSYQSVFAGSSSSARPA